jgi:hypothetical protein
MTAGGQAGHPWRTGWHAGVRLGISRTRTRSSRAHRYRMAARADPPRGITRQQRSISCRWSTSRSLRGLHREAGIQDGCQAHRRDGRLRADATGPRRPLPSLLAILGNHPFAIRHLPGHGRTNARPVHRPCASRGDEPRAWEHARHAEPDRLRDHECDRGVRRGHRRPETDARGAHIPVAGRAKPHGELAGPAASGLARGGQVAWVTGMKQAQMRRAETEPILLPGSEGVAPQGVELRHLRYFAAAADAGTFTHAADPRSR